MAKRDRPKQKFPRDEEDEEDEEREDKGGWKAWARDIAVAVLIMIFILGGMFAYTQVWPPLVVVESSSMQHGDTSSFLGVIDTGDLVLVQTAPSHSDVTTYLQGRASGYTTYGDYGDVIVFRIATQPSATPIIHRAIMWLRPNGTNAADVPDLAGLPTSDWRGLDRNDRPTNNPYGLTSVWIRGMGYGHNLNITFDLASFASTFHRGAGYVTMGDNNAYLRCVVTDPCTSVPYDTSWFPTQTDIIGHARGEIPWFGLIKLLLSPTPGGCCHGWGDPRAPLESWNDLAISLVVLLTLPFVVEAAVWAWSKYAWPWVGPRLPWRKKKAALPDEEQGDGDQPGDDEGDGPREGSSGP